MNYVLTVVLLLAILVFALGIYRLARTRADYEASTARPENLRLILKDMLRAIEAKGQWAQLEFMREAG